jgi:anti-sigma regulatory factor (Ser/Thr protein kinase)
VHDARQFVSKALNRLPPEISERARLLVSELATNALLYSAGSFKVSATYLREEKMVRVGVTDDGSGEPRVNRPDRTAEHGRGLQLVAAFSDRWWVEKLARVPGKTVWFELLSVGPPEGPLGGAGPGRPSRQPLAPSGRSPANRQRRQGFARPAVQLGEHRHEAL